MFDLGDLTALSARDLLKITHVFVTHAHMDHFIGFDTLLRIFLGRDKVLHIFGPPNFFAHVEGRLAGYTWNLVDEYKSNFLLKVTEVHTDKTLTRTYACRNRFKSDQSLKTDVFTGLLLKDPAFHVEAVILDHRIPCLGISLIENFSVNIIKEELKNMGLPVGPWLNRFKTVIYEKRDFKSDFTITWEEEGRIIKKKTFILGDLVQRIAIISPGKKITYITDVIGSPENYEKIIKLADRSDHLFIEAAFMHQDLDIAKKKYHLTALEAGQLAKGASVKQLTLFHFSPRYSHQADELRKEAGEGFGRTPTCFTATNHSTGQQVPHPG